MNEENARFFKKSNLRAAGDLLFHWGSLFAIFFWVTGHPSPFSILLGIVVISGLQHGLLTLGHDAIHRSCFSSNKMNDGVGSWLYTYPFGVPYYHDQLRHFLHHKLLGMEKDPDWVNYNNEGRKPAIRLICYLLGRLVLMTQLWSILLHLLRGRSPRVSVEVRSHVSLKREFYSIVLVQVFLFCFFAVQSAWYYYFVLWAFPIVSFTSFFVALRSFIEHCEVSDNPDPSLRLFDCHPNPLEAFFVCPNHFNYHALHHAYPSVPHYHLKSFKAFLIQKKHFYPSVTKKGYFHGLYSHLGKIATPLNLLVWKAQRT